MAKVNQGILDGFMGKLGTVVGFFIHGVPLMRGYVRHSKKSPSESQQVVRMKFKKLCEVSHYFEAAYHVGLEYRAKGDNYSEYANFIELNMPAMGMSEGRVVTVDYSKVVLSRGYLPQVLFRRPDLTTPQEVSADFAGNLELDRTCADDQVYLFVHCPALNASVLSEPVKRNIGSVTASVPANWNGLEVHVWGFTIGGGADTMGLPSDSAYLGSGELG